MRGCPKCGHDSAYVISTLAYSVVSDTKARTTLLVRCQYCNHTYRNSGIVVDFKKVKKL